MKIKDKKNYCRICLNCNMDYDRGLLCGLTDEKPAFEKICPSFKIDEKNAERLIDLEPDVEKIMKQVYVEANKPEKKKKKRFSFFK